MQNLSLRQHTSRPAFTLTEMLVVLVIVGLLAAVVGPRLFSRLDDAKARTARVQIASIKAGLDLFRLDVGRLPTAEEGLSVLVVAPADAENWLGPYLSRDGLPLDPWGNSYAYAVSDNGEGFEVFSFGADGLEGGEGIAADVRLQTRNDRVGTQQLNDVNSGGNTAVQQGGAR